jgi:hypothetical protein
MMEFHNIYKVTNILTNKIFIGFYYGKISILNRIQLKQPELVSDEKILGRQNFKREILFSYDNRMDMKIKYKEIVNKSFFNTYNTYNRNIFNKVPVVDKNGNKFLKDKNDPNFHEYVCVNKGMATVKNKDGKIFQVSVNDPLYIDGTYVHMNKKDKPPKPPKKIRLRKPPQKGLSQSEAQKQYRIKLRAEKYLEFNFPITVKGKLFYVENFCEHGDLFIRSDVFHHIYFNLNNNKHLYCEKCKDAFLSSIEITEKDISDSRNKIKEFYKRGSSCLSEIYIKNYHPILYKCITDNSSVSNWVERVFLFKEGLNNPKKCIYDGCENNTSFSPSNQSYNFFCEKHVNSWSSKGEIELHDYIQSVYSGEIKKLKIEKRELDIYLPEKNLAIEFNGLYWHSDNFKDKFYHYNKWKFCKDNNIHLITIWEDDWNFKKDIVKSIINNQLNLSTKIYARNCVIKEINKNDEHTFLIENHLQGHTSSSIKLGLYYNDELVSCMTFGKRKISGNSYYELIRFCSKLNTVVIGGASKLFKNFLKYGGYKNIISYASCDIGWGNLYKELGFTEIGYTGANYWWSDNINKYHRSNFMKHKLIKNSNQDKVKTENEIMRNLGYYKIWGTGNIKFEYMNCPKLK